MSEIRGKIKTLLKEKSCGFIRTDDGEDFFFHLTGLRDGVIYNNLQEGQRVSFEPDPQAPKGPRAKSVRVVAP